MDLCWKGILVDKCLDIKLFGIVDILNVIEKVVICLYCDDKKYIDFKEYILWFNLSIWYNCFRYDVIFLKLSLLR